MNRQTQMKNILDNWDWFQRYKADNKKVARFFYYIMVAFNLALFFAIWLEPTRGSIGSLVRLNPAFLFVISQLLLAGMIIYGINSTRGQTTNFLWFAANSGVIFLCLYPFVDNLYQIVTFDSCDLLNSHLTRGGCRLTAWHSVILLLMLAFYHGFFATRIDTGNESEVRQEAMLASAAELATDNVTNGQIKEVPRKSA